MMVSNEEAKHNFKISSTVGNWRKSFSLALSVPNGFLPKMDSDDSIKLSIVSEPSFLVISFPIVPDDNHLEYQSMYEKRLSPYMFKEILRRIEINMMTDVDVIIS